MKVREVCATIEELAPLGLAYPWDRVGLAVGSSDAEVSRVLIALTLTREAFKAAVRAKAQLIVVHHPPIWEPLQRLRTDDEDTRLLLELAGTGISCYAAHTNLDVAPGGMNDVVANRLGLVECRRLLPVPHAGQVKLVTFVPETHLAQVRDAVCEAGAGVIGEYTFCSFSAPGVGTFLPGGKSRPFSGRKNVVNEEPERRFEVLAPKARLDQVLDALRKAHPYEEVAYDIVNLENVDPSVSLGVRGMLPKPMKLGAFAEAAGRSLGVPHVRVVSPGGKRAHRLVRVVGVLAGSGGSEVRKMPADLDVLVTGDVRYHDALAAHARGLALVDAGHAGMEKWIVPCLAELLREKCRRLRISTYMEPELFRSLST